MRRKKTSRFTPVVFALLSAAGLLTTAIAAQRSTGPGTPAASAAQQIEISGRALGPAAQSRAEGDVAMDGAVAAAVIGAVSSQFGERRVEVKLDEVLVQPASLRDRNVSGRGRILIGEGDAADDSRWIPIEFNALYDTQTTSVSYPALVFGDGGSTADELALDAPLAVALGERIDEALAREFSQQPAQMVVDRVTTSAAGARYLRVEALGTADFASEGTTAAQVNALYDRKTGEWIRVAYELGTTSNWGDGADAAVAAR